MAKAKKKKRAEHYEDKLQISGSFEDVIQVSVNKVPEAPLKPEEKNETKEEKPAHKKDK
jgi:hypothetical protein